MVKTSAQPYKHIIHMYTYTIIYNEQPVSQDSIITRPTHCHAGKQQHKVLARANKLPIQRR